MKYNKHIFYLPTNLDESFPDLIEIKAFSCNVKSIHKKNFKNLRKLKGLYLNNNQIEKISTNTFEDLQSLERLFLSKSKSFEI